MTIVNIKHDQIVIVDAEYKRNSYFIKEALFVSTLAEAALILEKKKNIRFVISSFKLVSDSISIPNFVKKENIIKGNILTSLNKDNASIEPYIINIISKETDIDEANAIYKFEAIKESDIAEFLSALKGVDGVDSITFEHHSLLSVFESRLSGSTYLAVFVDESQTSYLAVNNGTIVFSRTAEFNKLDAANFNERISDIEKTLLYFKQQYRGFDLSSIVFYDAFSANDEIFDAVSKTSTIRVERFDNLSIKSTLEPKILKRLLIELGATSVAKKYTFVPDILKKNKTKHYISLGILLISILYFGSGYLYYYSMHNKYHSELIRKNNVVDEYNTLASSVKLLNNDMLIGVSDKISGAYKSQGNLIQSMIVSTEIVNLQKPVSVSYTKRKDSAILSLYFEHKFTTLKDLATFQKEFKDKVHTTVCPTNYSINLAYKTDYGQLMFRATVTITQTLVPEKTKKTSFEDLL